MRLFLPFSLGADRLPAAPFVIFSIPVRTLIVKYAILRILSNSVILVVKKGAAALYGRRSCFLTQSHHIREEVSAMVHYSELFQLLSFLVAFASLIIQICKRK